MGYVVDRLTDDVMEEVRRLRRETASEVEVGALHAWAISSACGEQRRQIAEAIAHQDRVREGAK